MMDRGSNEDPLFALLTVCYCVCVYLLLCPYRFCTRLFSIKSNNIYLAQQSCAMDRRPSPNRCEPGSDTSCLAGPVAASPGPESCPDMGRWSTWDRQMKTLRSTNTPFTPYHETHICVICIGCGLTFISGITMSLYNLPQLIQLTQEEEVLSNCHAAYDIREKAELCNYFQ